MTLRRARFEALALAIFAITLGVYLWLSRDTPTTSDREGREQNVLPTFDPAEVRQIAIGETGAPDGAPVILRRQPDSTDLHDYRLETAGSAGLEVDRAELASLLRTLDFATFVRTTEGRLLPAEAFDATTPKVLLDVTMDSVSYHVVVGAAAQSVAGGRYAEVTGDDGSRRAGIVPDSLTSALTKDARELRGRRLFPYGKSQTKRLSVEHTQGDATSPTKVSTTLTADPFGFSVARASTPAAANASPPSAPRRADPPRVDGLFFQLARANLEAYPKTTTVPRTPPIIVTQEPSTGLETRLEIGGECLGHPGLVQVIRTAPDQLVGCTDQAVADALAPRELGLRGLWPLTVSEIDHLVIRSSGHTLDLIRDGASFRRLAPEPGLIELTRGNDYLQDLSSLALTEVPCRGDAVGDVRVVGQPEGSADGRELKLTLLRDRDASIVRREDDGACLALSERARWLLDPTSAWYESLELFNVRADDVVALTSFGPRLRREELVRTGDGLALAGRKLDEPLLATLLGELDPLSALRIAPRREGPPWTPQFELQLRARASGPFTLRIGPRVRGGYLAQLNGRRSEFVLAPHVVRVLTTSLESREPAQWDPAALLELSVSARGVTYHFRKVGEELLPTDDAPRELGAAVTEALSGLLPIAVVRDAPGPRQSTSSELRLHGRYDAGDGQEKQLSISIGDQALHGDQQVQQMTIGDSDTRYYVERAAVLALLGLL